MRGLETVDSSDAQPIPPADGPAFGGASLAALGAAEVRRWASEEGHD